MTNGKINEKTIGAIEMIFCAVLWSIGGILIKMTSCGPFVIAGVRSLFAALCMALFMYIKKIKFKINKKVVIGSVFTSCVFILFVLANKLTYAANAIVLQFTEPIFFLIFTALIYKERIKAKDMAAALVTLLGIALFFADSVKGEKLLGNFLAIGAGACLAVVYMVFARVEENERMSGMLLGHLVTALFGGIMFLIYPTTVTGTDVLFMTILGIFQLGIPYVLFCLAVGRCSPFACSLIGAIEPLLNPVWVMLFDGETPGRFALLGTVLVVGAVTAWSIADSKEIKNA